jgi:hypothetical protein
MIIFSDRPGSPPGLFLYFRAPLLIFLYLDLSEFFKELESAIPLSRGILVMGFSPYMPPVRAYKMLSQSAYNLFPAIPRRDLPGIGPVSLQTPPGPLN